MAKTKKMVEESNVIASTNHTNNEVEGQSKPVTIKEMIDSLELQMKDFAQKAEANKVMALKAEGALEVLRQIKT
tara:strand:+ start:524 stop:745 length:222 start_codon:yes stop_codon:yes gene_type:complete